MQAVTVKRPPALVSAALLLGALLACGGGSSKGTRCLAAADLGGQRSFSIARTGARAESEAAAKRSVCVAHCRYASSELETAYQAWRASPEGQAQGAPRDKGVAVDFVPSLKQLYQACLPRCAALVSAANTRVQCT